MKLLLKKFIIIVIISLPVVASGQCRSFIKKTCFPQITPYTHNGQLNSAILMAGQTAEMQMTFYSKQEYRVIVCAQESLQGVYFRLLDSNHKEMYNSASSKTPGMHDFKIGDATQQVILEIIVPKVKGGNNIVPSGCVSLLVGFMK